MRINMAKVYTVSEITSYISSSMRRDPTLASVSINGELSNVKYHAAGHIYFTLKDDGSQLSGIMFRTDAVKLSFRLSGGMQVIVSGRIGVYEKGGTYQIYAESIREAGRGELYERYLKLKEELEDRGMFSDEYKRPIPEYIKRLGVVTASTGAAVRDIINVTRRRNPYVEIILYPARVQGEGAAQSVAKGIRALDLAGVDVIIAGRGGGSIEDLWAFNEVEVAEAIFDSATPVISAVGHETDTTIADFVADLRAPTPSAAAELAVFDYSLFMSQLEDYRSALKSGAGRVVTQSRLRLKEAESALRRMRPDAVIAAKKMRLADAENEMRLLMKDMLEETRDRGRSLEDGMREAMASRIDSARHDTAIYAERLKGISPLEKLSHGYSYVTDESGANVRDAGKLKTGDSINIYMMNGRVTADVKGVEKTEY